MDNVTHALAGLLIAEAVVLALPERPAPAVCRYLWFASALSNNVPDFDFLYRRITPGKVGYLLHHRGHTHTLLVGLVLGVLTFALVLGFARARKTPLSRRERTALLALSLVGPLVHIAMDASNNYGVHPFWPLYDGWLYGDVVFIVEPWFWVLAVPPLAFAATSLVARGLFAAILLGGLALAWLTGFADRPTALVLTLASAAVTFGAARLGQRGRLALGLGGCLGVALVFALASIRARGVVAAALRADASRNEVIADTVLTPAPGNPICWNAVIIGRRGADYELAVARASLVPGLLDAERCTFERTGVTLGLSPPHRRSSASVRWEGEHVAPLAELRAFARNNCQAAAFLRWSRAPFWLERSQELYLGDLRYDRSSAAGFAELGVPLHPRKCPSWVPPWLPPRADLLSDASTEP